MKTTWLFMIAVAGLAFGVVWEIPWLAAPGGVLLLVLLVRSGFHPVDEGHVAVIQRRNRFARVSGPGQVWVTPILERSVQFVNVRLRPERFDAKGILSSEQVPLNFSVLISYRIDFSVAERLRSQVAYYTSQQWRQLVQSHLESALTTVVRAYPVLSIIGPDQYSWNEIQEKVRRHLADILKQWAIVLDENQGVILNNVQLPSKLQGSLEKALTAGIESETGIQVLETILHTYPGIPQPVLLELMQSLQGRSTSQMLVVPSDAKYMLTGELEVRRPLPDEHVSDVESSRKAPKLIDDARRRGIRIVKDITPKPKESKRRDQ